jgi:hypothetical protein
MLTNILKAILSIFITPPVADAGDYRRSKTAVTVMVIIAVTLVGLVFYTKFFGVTRDFGRIFICI